MPLPLHFNADDHNINDLKVRILKGNFIDAKHRKLTELQSIINMKPISLVLLKTFSNNTILKHFAAPLASLCPMHVFNLPNCKSRSVEQIEYIKDMI